MRNWRSCIFAIWYDHHQSCFTYWNTRLHSLGVSVEASPDRSVPIKDCQHTESKSNMESGKRGTHETSSKLCSESRSGDQMPNLPKRTASQRRRAYRPSQPAPVPTGTGRPRAMVFQMPEVRAANRDCNISSRSNHLNGNSKSKYYDTSQAHQPPTLECGNAAFGALR